MYSVECQVWSVKWRVSSLECKVWSVECKVWFFDVFENEWFCSFPHRYYEARDSRGHMWEPENEHFVRDFLQF